MPFAFVLALLGDEEGVGWRREQTSYVVIERNIFLNLLQRSGRCIDPTG